MDNSEKAIQNGTGVVDLQKLIQPKTVLWFDLRTKNMSAS